MPIVADWKQLASSGLLVLNLLMLCCFVPLAAGDNEPQSAAEQCGKPKSVLVDVKDNTRAYNIPYSVCVHQNQACEENCGDPHLPVTGKITEALLYMGNSGSVQRLPHDDQTFNVTLQGESFTKTGVDNWTVSYKYETDGEFIFEHCTCQVNLTLIIVVDDLELTGNLNGDKVTMQSLGGSEKNFQAKQITTDDNKHVTLNCSSGLQDHQTPLRFKFVFSRTVQDQMSINEEYDRTVWCNETNDGKTPYSNWEIIRLDDACLLRLTEFSQMDNGTYGCILYNPDSNSHYNDDLSNTIYLIAASDTKPASAILNVIFVVTITVGALIGSSIILIVSVYAIYSYRKRRVGPTPNPQPDEEQANSKNYGTFSQNPDSNLSRSSSPVRHLVLASQPSQTQRQPIAQETGLTDDTEQTRQSAEPTIAKHGSNIVYSDNDLTTLAITGLDNNTPLCNHPDRTCDMSLICRQCRKAYCSHQSQYFRRHNLHCRGAATDGPKGASLHCTDQHEDGHGSGSDSSNSTAPSIEGSGHGEEQ